MMLGLPNILTNINKEVNQGNFVTLILEEDSDGILMENGFNLIREGLL
jgi:hypothetical protein